ncbi:MAG: phosphatidate cytidylyltransferase [Candidatus Didemnitutus sp.]|nr:phosphatidate cytidylyltransferase [Candidatus Didemnitutus sp.]
MLSRILSTLLLWTAILSSLWFFGPHAAVFILTALAVLTLHEFFLMAEKLGFRPFRCMAFGFSVLMIAAPYYLTEYFFNGDEFVGLVPALLGLAVVACAFRLLGERDETNRIETLAATIVGLVYVPFMLHFLVRLLLLFGEPTVGLMVCLWVVAVAKFCDVGALLSGLAFGKHKMSPQISPKKTWEGAVGGVLISMGVGAGLAWWAGDYLPDNFTPLNAALVALPLAIVTIVSDLIESAMKRRADLKDTGAVIPGIGGAFDLTDSLILTAPVAYVIFLFLS